MPRVRRINLPEHPAGYIERVYGNGPNDWDAHGSYPISTGFEACQDNPPGGGTFLQIAKFKKELPEVSLVASPDGARYRNLNGWIPHWFYLQTPDWNNAIGTPTHDYVAVKTMAGTNPSRPAADIPVAALELGDVVKLIRSVGQDLIQKRRNRIINGPDRRTKEVKRRDAKKGTPYSSAAEANIGYQFGIAPLISDLQAVVEFQEQVAKRVQELKRMVKKGGITKAYRKKTPFEATQTVYHHPIVMNSAGIYLVDNGMAQSRYKVHKWGVAKWVPDSGHAFPKDEEAMRKLARDAVYGMTLDLSTLWELIPWSWLVDYALSIGSYLAAHRNMVPASCSQLYVCTHRTNVTETRPFQHYNLSVGGARLISESKERDIVPFTTPAAHLPFLNGSQMSIVASLSVLKGRNSF